MRPRRGGARQAEHVLDGRRRAPASRVNSGDGDGLLAQRQIDAHREVTPTQTPIGEQASTDVNADALRSGRPCPVTSPYETS